MPHKNENQQPEEDQVTFDARGSAEFDRFGIAWVITWETVSIGAGTQVALTVDCQLFRDANPLDSHWFRPESYYPSQADPSIYPFNLDLK